MKMIIVGGGKVGSHLAGLLTSSGYQVILIEQNPEHVEQLRRDQKKLTVVQGSGSNPLTLEEAGISNADAFAAVTGADETNLIACNLARFEYHVNRVIARVNNPKNAWLFEPKMGIDWTVNQSEMIGQMIAQEFPQPMLPSK